MIEYTEGIYTYYVYILTNKNKTVLYTGVTNNLKARLHQHESKINPGSFTARYNAHNLIYFEKYSWIQLAIEREKEIKNLTRDKKLHLIREINPNLDFWNDKFKIEFPTE